MSNNKVTFSEADIKFINYSIRLSGAVCKKSRRYEKAIIIGIPGKPGSLIVTRKSKSEVIMHHFPKVEPKVLSNDMSLDWQKEEYYDVDFCEPIEFMEWAGMLYWLMKDLQNPDLHYRSEEYDEYAKTLFGRF